MDKITELKDRLDTGDMYSKIASMPDHLMEGTQIAQGADLRGLEEETFRSLVVSGMGGSAIGGEIAKSYLIQDLQIPFIVQRHYGLPGFVNKRSLVICSSYSGNTEEVLAAYDEASSRGASIISITSGGTLGEKSMADKHPLVIIPGGLPPRAALGYSFAPLLTVMFRLGICPQPFEAMKEAAGAMRERLLSFSPENSDNPALELAGRIHGTIPVIYGGADNLDAAANRFKCQICENAECLAFANVFPESNHNELVGWGELYGLKDRLSAVMLRDQGDHPRIRARMDIVSERLRSMGCRVIDIRAKKVSRLTRIFRLIQLLDFASYYLALLNGRDPTPVEAIDLLKMKLAKIV
jgi:glucose/mannose-6-phosphate isomerase